MTQGLAVSDLTGGRGPVIAFRDVGLSVDTGSILTLLGPNGAGKTTLLLTIAGLLPPKEGTISVGGTPLPNGRPSAANDAGVVLVPDNRCLFGSLSVEENLRVAAIKNGPGPRDLLDIFPALEPRWKLRASALSGGEQQMLAMARALIQEPKVLLVDELSMGLAPRVVEALFEAVRRIAADQGCAVVLVEQHVSLALEVADEAVVLNHGTIVLRGAAAALREQSESLEQAYLGVSDTAGASSNGE
jgi:branched-chain amino acid transport system ATP-binding protein